LSKYNSFVAGWLASPQSSLRSWKRKVSKIAEQMRNNKKRVKIVAILVSRGGLEPPTG